MKNRNVKGYGIKFFSTGFLIFRSLLWLFGLHSGYIPLRKFGYIMKKVTFPKCELCGIDEDVLVHHFLVECVLNAEALI